MTLRGIGSREVQCSAREPASLTMPTGTRTQWGTARRGVLMALTFASTACSPTDAPGSNRVEQTDSAGVRILTYRTPSWTDSSRWRIDTAVQSRITSDGSDGSAPFRGFIAPVLLEDGGSAFVTETLELRWYDAGGRLRVQRSLKGQGPGEFRSFPAIRNLRGDTLELSDLIGHKVATYDHTGTLVASTNVDLARLHALGHWGECVVRLWPGGYRTNCAHDTSIPKTGTNKPIKFIGKGLTSLGEGRFRSLRRTWLLSPTLDAAVPLGVEGGIEQFGLPGNDFVTHPFYSHSLIAAGGTPFRVFTMRNPEYEIAVWDSTGRLLQQWRVPDARHVASEADHDAARQFVLEQEGTRPNRQRLEQLLHLVDAPDTLPAAVSLVMAETGELLVQRASPPRSADSIRTDVFAVDGQWLGTIALPPRSSIRQLTRDRVLLLRSDDDDVMTLEVRRVYRQFN